MRFIFPCTRDLQTFLSILELCIFIDFPCIEDFEFLRFSPCTEDFFNGISYVLETLRLYKLSSYTGDFELLLISPCTGDYEFYLFPCIENFGFYEISHVMGTLNFYKLPPIRRTLNFHENVENR